MNETRFVHQMGEGTKTEPTTTAGTTAAGTIGTTETSTRTESSARAIGATITAKLIRATKKISSPSLIGEITDTGGEVKINNNKKIFAEMLTARHHTCN